MDKPQENASELLALALALVLALALALALALDSESYGEVMSRLLALPTVKSLQFYFVVTLVIGSSSGTDIKAEDNFGLLRPPPVKI